MNSTDQRALDILRDLGERPAAPFHEEPVATYIFDRLVDLGLTPFRDEFGNVVVNYSNSDTDDPPIAFVAHMDHPGFEIDDVDDDGPVGVALGGSRRSRCRVPRTSSHSCRMDGEYVEERSSST